MRKNYLFCADPDFIGQDFVWGKGFMSPRGHDFDASLVDGIFVERNNALDAGLGPVECDHLHARSGSKIIAFDINNRRILQ